jgi:hypothetical protein
METEIEKCVSECHTCQRLRPSQKSVLKPWPVPKEAWCRVHADLGQLDGSNFLVVSDAKTGFIAAEWVREIEATSVIRVLRRAFCNFGIPEVLVTDNGRQFVAHETEAWLKRMGVLHLKSPRYHPASNGVAEAAVKKLKTKLKQLNDPDPEVRMQQALYAVRVCPRANGVAPCREMFGREFNTRLSLLHRRSFQDKRIDQAYRPVWVQDPFNKEWREGVLREAVGEQLRRVQDEQGRDRVVHRDHVRNRAEATKEPVREPPSAEDQPMADRRYPQRMRRPPERYQAQD